MLTLTVSRLDGSDVSHYTTGTNGGVSLGGGTNVVTCMSGLRTRSGSVAYVRPGGRLPWRVGGDAGHVPAQCQFVVSTWPPPLRAAWTGPQSSSISQPRRRASCLSPEQAQVPNV